MHKKNEQKDIYEEGFEEYPILTVIGQNLFFVLYFSVGFVILYPFKVLNVPIISLFYVMFLIIMLLFVLRKHLCTNCYYYGKRCSTGWGKLSSLLFKEKSGNYNLGIKLAQITWRLSTIIPLVGAFVSLISNFTVRSLGLLLFFLFLSFLNFIIHKNSCKNCKMRNICPANMVKRK